MGPRLTADARVALLRAATFEATRRGERYLGTEYLLLGLLAEPSGVAERALGVDLDAARDALRRFDGEALDAIGIDPGLASSMGRVLLRRRLPFTSGTKQALVRAIRDAGRRRATPISSRHLLIGVLGAQPPDPAALLLRFLGCDVDYIRRTLLDEAT